MRILLILVLGALLFAPGAHAALVDGIGCRVGDSEMCQRPPPICTSAGPDHIMVGVTIFGGCSPIFSVTTLP